MPCSGSRPMVIAVGPAQGSDSKVFSRLLAALHVPHQGAGRPRTTPEAVMADKTYSSRAHRVLLSAILLWLPTLAQVS